MGSQRILKFYFDYISNNAYIAWTQIHDIVKTYDLILEPVPVLFAGLLNAHDQKGPAEIPAKRKWMRNNVIRKAKDLGVPLSPPASHPFNPLLALRASLLDMSDSNRKELITELFECVWARGIDVSREEIITGILSRYGIDKQSSHDLLNSEAIKVKLRNNTDLAVRAGVFGVPTMLIEGQLFWGYDDFPHLIGYLSGNDVLTQAELSNWGKVKGSAKRCETHRTSKTTQCWPTR